jgi:hypothetical protein
MVRNKNSRGRGGENAKVSTTRGRRRVEKTQEYEENCKTRGSQSYPKVSNTQPGKGPLKGPSKRPSGMSQEQWRNLLGGGK